jgi:hypothetical protein
VKVRRMRKKGMKQTDCCANLDRERNELRKVSDGGEERLLTRLQNTDKGLQPKQIRRRPERATAEFPTFAS